MAVSLSSTNAPPYEDRGRRDSIEMEMDPRMSSHLEMEDWPTQRRSAAEQDPFSMPSHASFVLESIHRPVQILCAH